MHVTFSSPSFYLPFLLLCGLITLSPLSFFLSSLSSPLWTYHTFSSLLLSIFPFFPFFSYVDLSHFPLSPCLPTHLLCEFITPFPLPSLPCLFVSNLCHFINFILLYSVLLHVVSHTLSDNEIELTFGIINHVYSILINIVYMYFKQYEHALRHVYALSNMCEEKIPANM